MCNQILTGEKTMTLNAARPDIHKIPCVILEELMTYQKKTGTLTANSHPGSYCGQDAYNDMFVTEWADESNNTGDISLNNSRGISTDSESTGLQRSSDCDAGGWII